VLCCANFCTDKSSDSPLKAYKCLLQLNEGENSVAVTFSQSSQSIFIYAQAALLAAEIRRSFFHLLQINTSIFGECQPAECRRVRRLVTNTCICSGCSLTRALLNNAYCSPYYCSGCPQSERDISVFFERLLRVQQEILDSAFTNLGWDHLVLDVGRVLGARVLDHQGWWDETNLEIARQFLRRTRHSFHRHHLPDW